MCKWTPEFFRDRFASKEIRPDRLIELFIGGPGSPFFTLHYDIFLLNNFISQIYGEKEFFLFPPDQTPYLYPKPDHPKHSAIEDPEHSDLQRFPLFAKAKPIRLVLKPGGRCSSRRAGGIPRGCSRHRSRWGRATPTGRTGPGSSRTCARSAGPTGRRRS